MILARVISQDSLAALRLGFTRLSLPQSAADYIIEKLPHAHLLLTGLEEEDARFLKRLSQDVESSQLQPGWLAADARRRNPCGLLSGRRDQLERAVNAAREAGRVGLAAALASALAAWLEETVPSFELGPLRRTSKDRPWVMGVVNVTPDSFSDGGQFLGVEAAVAHALSLEKAGADVLDVGGESTRPGAAPVSAQEELARVLPVLRALRQRTQTPISVDTRKAEVARVALAEGASIINDITGFMGDAAMASVVTEGGGSCCLMHIQGTPESMQSAPRYEDVVAEVYGALASSVERAVAAGIPRARVWVDPGIGFGKTFGQNLFLLRHLTQFRGLGAGILVGTSRKAFLGSLTGGKPASQRLAATVSSVACTALLGGADMVRVHDVGEAVDALIVAQAIATATEGGTLFSSGELAAKSSAS